MAKRYRRRYTMKEQYDIYLNKHERKIKWMQSRGLPIKTKEIVTDTGETRVVDGKRALSFDQWQSRVIRMKKEKKDSRPSTKAITNQIINEQVYTYNMAQARAVYQYARYNEPEFEGKRYSFLDVMEIMSGQHEDIVANYKDVLSIWYELDKQLAIRKNNGVLPEGWSSKWARDIAVEDFGSDPTKRK